MTPTAAKVKYEGFITQELFAKAQHLHVGKWRLLLWLFPVLMTVWSLVFLQDSLTSVLVFGVSCLFPVVLSRISARQWRRIHRESPYLQEPVNATLTDEGIEFLTATSSGVLPWSRFIKMKESDDLVLLYQAPNLFNIVPKEFFASPQQWADARALVHLKIQSGNRSAPTDQKH